ncbi:succinylglutamate desuccinylase [Vibrio sp. RC27]
MFDFLAETLTGDKMSSTSGQTEYLTWSRPAPGMISLEPNATTRKSVVISVGIHGNETAPIEIVSSLVSNLLSGHQALKVRLMVIIGNLEAMRSEKRYLNIDMNRLFSDHYLRYKPCYETQRAQEIQQVMTDFYSAERQHIRHHFDLHTAIRSSHHLRFGVLPYLREGNYCAESLSLLQSMGLEALVINHAPSATFSYFSSNEFGAASCTLELGKAKPFGANDLRQFNRIEQGLIDVISDVLPRDAVSSELQVYRVAEVLTKTSPQFKLNVDDDVKNFTAFPKGFVLTSDGEAEYRVQPETGYILFPNNHVNVGFRAGLLLEKEPALRTMIN